MDESWTDGVFDARAREGEHLDDVGLGTLRLERRQREIVDQLVAGFALANAAMFDADEETRQHLLDEGYDVREVDEAYRRVAWLDQFVTGEGGNDAG